MEGENFYSRYSQIQVSKNTAIINASLHFDVCVTEQLWYNSINSQLDATIIILLKFQSAQHVSGDNFAHPQEH